MKKIKLLYMITWVMLVGLTEGKSYKVAWLAPQSSNTGIQASSSVGGLALAMETIQKDPNLLAGDNFTIVWKDSGCDSKPAIGALYDVIMSNFNPDVIIGPACSSAMYPISELASTRNVTIIGWFSADAELANKDKHTTLIRVYGSTDAIGAGLINLLDIFNWKRIFLISSNSTSYHDAANGIYEVFEDPDAVNYTLIRWTQEVSLQPTDDEVNNIYSNVQKEARIVVMCIPRDQLRKWMLLASDNGMVGGDYVFIFVDPDLPTEQNTAFLMSQSLWKKGDGRDEDAFQGFKNVIMLLRQPNNKTITEEFRQSANLAVQNSGLDAKLGLAATTPDDYAPFLHDALVLYAKLVNETGANYQKGEVLRAQASNRIFQGNEWASSDMVLNSNSDRDPTFFIYDLQPSSRIFEAAYIIGCTVANGTKRRTVKKLKDIIWGNDKSEAEYIPPDVPVCGFSNENCPANLAVYIGPAVAALVLIIIIIIVILAYRHYKYEKELQNMGWKILYPDLKFKARGKTSSEAFRALAMSSERVTSVASSIMSSESLASQMQMFVSAAKYEGSLVAVKSVRKQVIKQDRELLLEMRKMADLKHTNLTLFIGACMEPGTICVVWEYCPKGSIQDVIWNENIDLDDMFKFSIAIDIASGLLYLHDSPLKLHGRLKSSDCVIDGRWVCKLTDFGLVNFRSGEETDPEMSDHKRYWSSFWTAPEVLQRWNEQECIPLSTQEGDVYGLGVILKEIFARNGPYTEMEDMDYTSKEIVEQIKQPEPSGTYIRPCTENLKCPDGLVKILKLCWSEQPDSRPSASVVLKSLKRVNPYKKYNVMDNMIAMMEKHSQHLEEIMRDRTVQLQEEKQKTETLLYKMMPKSVAENLKRGNPVQAESFKVVTIYFSDILGFNDLCAECSPLQVVDILNGIYSLFDETVSNHDVYKVETVGDVYVLVSGLPIRNGDRHIAEIANCALDILSGAQEFSVPHKKGYPLNIRIGIHTGPVVAGVIGLAMPRYCLFGDTINTSSRMESTGAAHRIHLSPFAYSALAKFSGYFLADRGHIDVKGKGRMNTYWLLGKDSYDRPLPDYNAVFGKDNPQPKKLPATVGKIVRDRPSRISTDSAFFDTDGSRGSSRRTSAVEVSVFPEGRKISGEAIQEIGESDKGSPSRRLSDVFTADEMVDEPENVNTEFQTKDTETSLNDNEQVVFSLGDGTEEDKEVPAKEDENIDNQNGDAMWQRVSVPQEHNIEIMRPQTATRLVEIDESL